MKFLERTGIAIMSAWGLFAVHQGVNALVRAHNWQPMTISDWGTWTGSIGTVATLIGTIYLATSESRRRNQVEMQIAELRAVQMMTALEAARFRLLGIQRFLNAAAINDPGHSGMLANVARSISEIPTWDVEDALPFAPLPGSISRTLVQLFVLLGTMRQVSEINSRHQNTVEDRISQARELLPLVAVAIEMIAEATTVLNKHARLVRDRS